MEKVFLTNRLMEKIENIKYSKEIALLNNMKNKRRSEKSIKTLKDYDTKIDELNQEISVSTSGITDLEVKLV